MRNELIVIEEPQLPVKWNYKDSVKKVLGCIYKWKNLTAEMAQELWVAREILAQKPDFRGRESSGTFVPVDKNWTTYCKEIGSCRRVVNRWLNHWFPRISGDRKSENEPESIITKVRETLGEIVPSWLCQGVRREGKFSVWNLACPASVLSLPAARQDGPQHRVNGTS